MPQINVLVTNLKWIPSIRKKVLELDNSKVIEFRPFLEKEKIAIMNNFYTLIQKAKVEDVEKLIIDLISMKNIQLNIKRFGGRINKNAQIIGCYLSQDLSYVRHCAYAVRELRHILIKFKTGNYSVEEDALILKHVQKYDDESESWKKVTQQLNRKWPQSVRSRYTYITKDCSKVRTKWDLANVEILLRQIFKVKMC